MHATRDTSDVVKLNRAGGRVMRGVGRLVAHTQSKVLRAGSREKKTVAAGGWGVVEFPSRWRESWAKRAARSA
jgi:hypothetical protein